MRFYMAEKEAFDELGACETLGDVVRIGFNRVDFKDKNGDWYECYDITESKWVIGYKRNANAGEDKHVKLPIDIEIDQFETALDRDEDQYTIVIVEELVRDEE